ncbi:hypothetical protein Zmor_021596 [Zophobas morio]|uniref:PDZ domain-containing protein n=1 Tax=Zophobas morio TaxID=2755281 RepID=A0AA38I6M9_9CUCU|nr:hypothetical protein Zmor_021596 [Zophobas morio]
MVLNTEWAQVEVIDLINDGSGLAFGIIGGRSTGVVVKTILPGGVADRIIPRVPTDSDNAGETFPRGVLLGAGVQSGECAALRYRLEGALFRGWVVRFTRGRGTRTAAAMMTVGDQLL